MIESLTQKEKDLLKVYRDKWLSIGLCTKAANHAEAEDAIHRAYKIAALTPPKQIIWATSPLAGVIVASILKNDELMKKIYKDFKKTKRIKPGASVWASVWASVRDSVRDSVWASVRASVWASVWASVGDSVGDSVGASVGDSVGDSVGASVGASVRDSVGASVWASVRASVWASVRDSVGASVWASVGDSVWASVRDSVWASVRASVGASVGASVRDSVGASVGDSVYGQQDAAWLGFYNYFLEVLKIEACSKLIPLMDLARNANWWIPYKNIVIVSEKPTQCHLKAGKIHCETGPSILYPDGFSVYALNGIRVPQWLVETPTEKLDIKRIMAEKNVDIRREGLRKIPIENVFKETKAKELDSWKEYQLFSMDFNDGKIRKILRMRNPSIGVFHMERVEDDIKTVKEALAWRNGLPKFSEPLILT